jgi:CRP-like cAMP-binding protein
MRKVLYIFGQLNDGDVRWLARSGRRTAFSRGDVLLEQGVELGKILFVLEGELAVTVADTPIARLGVGEVVGEMSFVDTAPPSATVSALTDGIVLEIAKAALEQKTIETPAFGMRFYKAMSIFLADRLRETTRRLGYGPAVDALGAMAPGELDERVLDGVSLAGARFERILREMRRDP